MALKKTIGKLKRKVSGYMTRRRQENLTIAKIRRTEKLKQREETARYSEKIAGERRRKYVAAGGFGGEMRRGFGGVGKAFGGPVMASSKLAPRRKKKAKKKKSKRSKKK